MQFSIGSALNKNRLFRLDSLEKRMSALPYLQTFVFRESGVS